jgi:hypothetical protein
VSDFVPDDLFVLDEIDLADEVVPAPVDPGCGETVVDTEIVTEFWFAELSTAAVPDVDQLATDLVLPDPFRPQAGLGAGALLATALARRRADGPSGAEKVATVAQLADTSASIVQRLSGLARRRSTEGERK